MWAFFLQIMLKKKKKEDYPYSLTPSNTMSLEHFVTH